MKNLTLGSKIKSSLLALLFVLFGVFGAGTLSQAQAVKNIVIVHGAFADGSGWKSIHNILVSKGYHVSVVQNPLTSLQDDVDAANRIIDRQDGPVILVGHSWGGTVITEAGVNPKVAALVYVAAFQPDKGENTLKWATSLPAAPESGLGKPDEKGFIYYDKTKFRAGFAADLSQEETDFMYDSQQPIVASSFGTPLKNAAWKTKPSYGIVATEDKSIVPQIQINMYKRSNTKITEVKGSHVIFMSQPQAVANVIIEAANNNEGTK
jgi:pimeloyl-ACP methyl ester carboxylesterase